MSATTRRGRLFFFCTTIWNSVSIVSLEAHSRAETVWCHEHEEKTPFFAHVDDEEEDGGQSISRAIDCNSADRWRLYPSPTPLYTKSAALHTKKLWHKTTKSKSKIPLEIDTIVVNLRAKRAPTLHLLYSTTYLNPTPQKLSVHPLLLYKDPQF